MPYRVFDQPATPQFLSESSSEFIENDESFDLGLDEWLDPEYSYSDGLDTSLHCPAEFAPFEWNSTDASFSFENGDDTVFPNSRPTAPTTCDQVLCDFPEPGLASFDGLFRIIQDYCSQHHPDQYTMIRYSAVTWAYASLFPSLLDYHSWVEYRLPPPIALHVSLLVNSIRRGHLRIDTTLEQAQLEVYGEVAVDTSVFPSLELERRLLLREMLRSNYPLFNWDDFCRQGNFAYPCLGNQDLHSLVPLVSLGQNFIPAYQYKRRHYPVLREFFGKRAEIYAVHPGDDLLTRVGPPNFQIRSIEHPLDEDLSCIATSQPLWPTEALWFRLYPISTHPVVLDKPRFTPIRCMNALGPRVLSLRVLSSQDRAQHRFRAPQTSSHCQPCKLAFELQIDKRGLSIPQLLEQSNDDNSLRLLRSRRILLDR